MLQRKVIDLTTWPPVRAFARAGPCHVLCLKKIGGIRGIIGRSRDFMSREEDQYGKSSFPPGNPTKKRWE